MDEEALQDNSIGHRTPFKFAQKDSLAGLLACCRSLKIDQQNGVLLVEN